MTLDALEGAAALLRTAQHITVLTGAGISKESGLPTFREAQSGLWAQYRPEELATPEAFARDPALVWSWYAWRRSLVRAAAPNAAHHALVRLAEVAPRLTLATQNVDGLHQRAGSPEVIELHGNITRVRCARCERYVSVDGLSDDGPVECDCGGYLRPDVVWFGEALPRQALEQAAEAAEDSDVFLVIGTSGVVFPAAGLTDIALRAGARVISINPDPASAPPGAVQLTGSAAALLPRLVELAWPRLSSSSPSS